MEKVAPLGAVYQAGTLSGNPLAMAAGIATLKILRQSDYAALEARVETLCRKLEAVFKAKGIPALITRLASMFTIFFTSEAVTDFASAKKADAARYARYFAHMRSQGVFLAPSAFETGMASFAHSEADFAAVIKATESFTG